MAPLTRVCVIGAESTGKSELAKELARHYAAVVVPEFAREYALSLTRPLDFFDVFAIAKGQIANEDRAAASARGLIILDTDLLSTVAYSRYYWGVCPEWIERAARNRLANLYLFMDIDVPWIADPARDANADRAAVHLEFERTLEECGARYVSIYGDWDQRRRRATDAIQAAR